MKLTCRCAFVSLSFLFIAVQLVFTQPQSAPCATQSVAQTSAVNSESSDKFEVASVRLALPEAGYTSLNNFGSSLFTAHNAPMRLLVGIAFGLSSGSIAGAPDWFESQLYDVNAKAAGDRPLSPKQFEPLLQQLLKERFHLAAHRETIYRPGYAIVLAKGGPKLQPSKGPSPMGYILSDEIRFNCAAITTLAGVLSSVLGEPVIDKTGLRGDYDFNVKFAPMYATDSALPSIFTALEEDLGLKLVPDKRVPVDRLIIDHAERIPTEN